MKICCLMDYIPSYEFTVADLYKCDSNIFNTCESESFEYSKLYYGPPKYSIYVQNIVSFDQPETFVFVNSRRGKDQCSRIVLFKFDTNALNQHPCIWYEIVSQGVPGSSADLNVFPLAFRAVFEGTPDECLLWKLSHGGNWVSYCDIQEHCYMVYEQ